MPCQPRQLAALLPLLVSCLSPARASDMLPARAIRNAGQPGDLCRAATTAAEAATHVPDAFLSAIARVETGRRDPATGMLAAWPWTVDAEGVGSFYATKAEAVAAVRTMQANGVRSIDVGCMQVNLLQHPDAFASLEQAFDPQANALYAAGFLVSLFNQAGSWPLAAAAYHSQTPAVGAPYERRVLAEWATPDAAGNAAPRAARAGRAPPDEVPARLRVAPAPEPAAAASVAPIGRAVPESGRIPPPAGGMLGRTLATYRLLPIRLARPG